MSGKLPISVCILVLNEEDRLERCLAGLDDFAEIVVLDSGSTDRSLEICRSRGAVVHQGEWLGFGRMRRRLFSLASQPWIFWLDADEVVRRELADEIRKVFARPVDCDAFAINRMVFFAGRWIRHGEWFPDWNVRLFRCDRWEMEPREVHESVTIKGRTGRLREYLEHHTYRDWNDRERRLRRYAELWARQKAAEGKRTSPLSGPLRSAWRFFRGYVLRRGFLDGSAGFEIALSNAREVALKYRLLRKHGNND